MQLRQIHVFLHFDINRLSRYTVAIKVGFFGFMTMNPGCGLLMKLQVTQGVNLLFFEGFFVTTNGTTA